MEFVLKNNFIYMHIRHICFRIISLMLIPLALFVLLLNQTPFLKVFRPFQLTYANSANTVYDSGNEYVQITLKDVTYTGYDCTRQGKRYGSYYYSLVNHSCTFIVVDTSDIKEVPATLDNYTISAKLVPHDSMLEQVLENFSQDMEWTYDGMLSVTSPIVIDETEYNLEFFRYLAFIYILVFLFILAVIIIHIIYFVFPWLYPACINFRRINHVHKGIAHVNHELNNRVIHQFGNITLTEHFLVAFTSFHLEIVPIKKIVWVYSHSRWHRILWFKSKLSYSLYITCKKNIKIYSPRNTLEDIEAVIEYFQDNYPDILIGFSKENKQEAKKIVH